MFDLLVEKVVCENRRYSVNGADKSAQMGVGNQDVCASFLLRILTALFTLKKASTPEMSEIYF